MNKEKQEYVNAIMARASRRTYLGTEIAPGALLTLREKITEANTESGMNVTWSDDGAAAMSGGKSYGMFRGVRSMLVLKGVRDLPHLREKTGYYGEILVLEATLLGLGTCWVGGTFDKNALSVPEGEELICVVPVGNVRDGAT